MSPEARPRRIGVVTVARSDYGLYKSLLDAIAADDRLELALYVAGTHLAPAFGRTVAEIEADGVPIAERIEMSIGGDTPAAASKSMGLGTIGFAQVFGRSRPDVLVVLGDRLEMHAAAVAAVPFELPIAHIHGGETTEGAIDEVLRHSMTKLSHLHFVATEGYARRLVRMGEEPWRVLVTGAPGLDAVLHTPDVPDSDLEEELSLSLEGPIVLVTYHPVTRGGGDTELDSLLEGLAEVDACLVFTYPNADPGYARILRRIEEFAASREDALVVQNLGSRRYFALMRRARAMVGNSSSGLIEAPSFGLPVVNVGPRQQGRIRAANVIDADGGAAAIRTAIDRACSDEFRASLAGLVNPYGEGHASTRIASHLAEVPLDARLLMKRFHDGEPV